MTYNDLYPRCAGCPYLGGRQTDLDNVSETIERYDMTIRANVVENEELIADITQQSIEYGQAVMLEKELGASDETIQRRMDEFDELDKAAADIQHSTESYVEATRKVLAIKNKDKDAIDTDVEEITSQCSGYTNAKALGDTACKTLAYITPYERKK